MLNVLSSHQSKLTNKVCSLAELLPDFYILKSIDTNMTRTETDDMTSLGLIIGTATDYE